MFITQAFKYEKETKNTHRYIAVDDEGAAVGTVYVNKSALKNGEVPKTLTMTLEKGDDS